MKNFAQTKSIVAALVCITFCAVAAAQWQWIGKDGRKVFSDQAPPADVQEKNILKKPAGSVRATTTAAEPVAESAKLASSAAAPAAKASAPKISGKDSELEAKKKKAEEEEAAKKKAEADKVAAAKADNCSRAKSGLTTLQSGIRISSVNSKGESIIMDDAGRAAETKRAKEVIDANCS